MTGRRTVFLFSGQGSQYFQMGRALFDQDPVFRKWMLRLDDGVHALSGNSIVQILYSAENDKAALFDRTQLTHPAIFMVEFSLAQALIRRGIVPNIVLGTSLGSFAAAAIAGFLDVEAALAAVIRQAAALETCCEPGVMLAILANPSMFSEESLARRSQMAAVNFDSHFVISAPQAEWSCIEAHLKKRGAVFQKLPVSFAFHSQWIDQAREPFESFMHSIELKENTLPLACSAQVDVLTELSAGYFWNVVRQPIRFRETIARLEQDGACRYIDVGPAGTLATLLKYCLPKTSESTIHSVLTPYGHDLKNVADLAANKQ